MRTFLGLLIALFVALPARAQVQVHIDLGLPVVLPPLVVVQPGVQVVSELDQEVYLVDGWYWARRGPEWYRAQDHRRPWAWVAPEIVPASLVRIPPGQYRRLHREDWKEERREERERWKDERREEREQKKEARRDWKEERKAEHKRWKEQEKAEREDSKEEKHKGRGHDRDDD